MMKIVPVGLHDWPVLREIGMRTFEETFAESNTGQDMQKYLAERFSPASLRREIENPDSLFFLAQTHENGQAAGYLKINFAKAQTEPQAADAMEIERIYVLAAFHGHGVGKALLRHAFEIARSRKASCIWLGVWERNQRARRFYEKNGFASFGQHVFRLGDDEQIDVLMRREP